MSHCFYYGVHRQPRTTQELRRACDPEEVRYTRSKRRKRALPNSWDDLMVGSGWWKRHVSWKLLRRHQCKAR